MFSICDPYIRNFSSFSLPSDYDLNTKYWPQRSYISWMADGERDASKSALVENVCM